MRPFLFGVVLIFAFAGASIAQLTPIPRGSEAPHRRAATQAAIKQAEHEEQVRLAEEEGWIGEPLEGPAQPSGSSSSRATTDGDEANADEQSATEDSADLEQEPLLGESTGLTGSAFTEQGNPPAKSVVFPATNYRREQWNQAQWEFERESARRDGLLDEMIADEASWELEQAALQAEQADEWARIKAMEDAEKRANDARWERNARAGLYLKDSYKVPSYATRVIDKQGT